MGVLGREVVRRLIVFPFSRTKWGCTCTSSNMSAICMRTTDAEEDVVTLADDAITLPTQLLDAVMAAGRKDQKIQRYKGLGEMNAEQLWETTLDPDNRALLQVKVEDADVTDEIFTRLMGDVVEPRREFIQDNALNVANLDI